MEWRVEALMASRASDAAALYRLFFPQEWERPWSSAEFATLLATPGCFGYLLVDQQSDAACGLVLVRAAADEAEILTLGTAPHCRRRGAASRLLHHAIAECTTRGALRLFLDVADDNEAARHFYSSFGFSVVGTRPAYYDRGKARPVAALVMRHDLAARSKLTDA